MKKIIGAGPKKETFTVEVKGDEIIGVQGPLGYIPAHMWPAVFTKLTPLESDVNLDDLMDKHLDMLYRETRSLMEMTARGKLDKDAAYSMRENMKLLMDLRKKEKELLDSTSTEELKKLLNKAEE